MNDHLDNAFKTQCQFGTLNLGLVAFTIPKMKQASNDSLNSLFLLKIKTGTEYTEIVLDVENGVVTPYTQQMTANIDSINDKVYLEFYDIIDEQAFSNSQGGVNDIKNLKL